MTHEDPSQTPSDDLRLVGADAGIDSDTDLRDHLEDDLLALDADLGRLLAGSAAASDDALVARVFEASRVDLPPRVIPIESAPSWSFRRLAAGIGAVAAAVAVAALANRAMVVEPVMDSGREVATISTSSTDPLGDLSLLEPRESELMLVAVLDPDEGWFDDDPFGTPLGAEPVLRSRAFGVDELEGAVFAMLGGPTS